MNRELEYGFDNDINACKKERPLEVRKGKVFIKVPQYVFAMPQWCKEWVDVHKKKAKMSHEG